MYRWFLSLAAIALLVASPVRAQSTPAGDDARARAREHFERGLTYANQEAFAQAVREFEAAHTASPHFAVLYNLGMAHVALGHPVEATDALERYLREGGDAVPTERRAVVSAELERQRSRIAHVRLRVSPPHARLTVDGVPRGNGAQGVLRLGLGRRVVRIEAPGYLSKQRELSVEGGQRLDLVVALESEVAPVPAKAELDVRCPLSDVRVDTAGRSLGRTPLGGPVLLDAGTAELTFTAPDGRSHRERLELRAGARSAVSCGLAAAQHAAPGSPAATASPGADAGTGGNTLAVVLTAGGGALLVGGVAAYLWNDGRASDWQDEQTALNAIYAQTDPVADVAGVLARQDDNDELAESIQTWDAVAIGTMVGGGVVAAVGAVLLLSADGESEAGAASVGLAPGRLQLGYRGRF